MTERSAGAVVACRSGGEPRFLLILDGHGNWGFPKGHIERGENDLDAAYREVNEETGIADPESLGVLGDWSWQFDASQGSVRKTCRFFLFEVAVPDAAPQILEGISDVVWLPLKRAMLRLTFDTSRDVLGAANTALADTSTQGSVA